MGMFDEVRILYPMPGGYVPQGDWPFPYQTKDFDCTMAHYTVTEDGRLLLHVARYEATPQEELPDPEHPMFGSIRRIEVGDEEIPHHGDINVISTSPDFARFTLRFTHGRLEWIRRNDDQGR